MRGKGSQSGLVSTVFIAVALTVFVGSLQASPIDELSTVAGKDHDGQWQRAFAVQLETMSSEIRLAPESLRIALRALTGTRFVDSPREAARFAFNLAVRVDRALRRGTPPAEVALVARQEARLSAHSETPAGTRETARTRMRDLLSGMGVAISDDVENRAGPQSGPGNGAGQGGIRTTGPGATSGTQNR